MNALRASRICLVFSVFVALPSWIRAQAPVTTEPDVQALQRQLDALRAQVADLQSQIKKLTSTDSASQGSSSSAVQDSSGAQQTKSTDAQQETKPSEASQEIKTEQAAGKATLQYQTNSQDEVAAARYDNAPLDPKYPGYFRLPGTKTFMKIGGYAKTDLTFDPRPAGDQE